MTDPVEPYLESLLKLNPELRENTKKTGEVETNKITQTDVKLNEITETDKAGGWLKALTIKENEKIYSENGRS